MASFPFENVKPDWPAPANIVAFTTCRQGGFSASPYEEFNLGMHVGDACDSVNRNRKHLLSACEGLQAIQWLKQVHGNRTIRADGITEPEADAAFTDHPGLACAVMTADCLPLLVCDEQGRQVAAIHAGWRGLLNGVIEKALDCFAASPGKLLVWLGPAIGPESFEVGAEIRDQFLAVSDSVSSKAIEAAFISSPVNPGHYLADLYALARSRLSAKGISAVYGGDYCCYKDSKRFYSYRRDGVTGRMASVIYLKP